MPGRSGTVLRLVLIALLALALAGPPLPAALSWLAPGSRAPIDVVALVDGPGEPERAWNAFASAARHAPPGSRATLLTTDSRPTLAPMPAARIPLTWPSVTEEATPTGEAGLASTLQQALSLSDPERALGIVLITDGDGYGEDVGEALEQVVRAGASVSWLNLRAVPGAASARVQWLHAPARLRPGAAIPVSVRTRGGDGRVGVLTLEVDGRLQYEQRLVLPATHTHTLAPLAPGIHRLRAKVLIDGAGPDGETSRETLITVAAPRPVLFVSRDRDAPMARSLAWGDWPLEVALPERLGDGLRESPSAVVLDDLALTDLPADALAELARRVRREAMGLLVLGGPRAFAAGGYAGSTLEDLLPVTAEGGQPGTTTALLFLVDTSGSMGRDAGRGSREGQARRAVAEVAAGMAPGDLTGLYTFDVALHRTLALTARARPQSELRDALSALGASGGTRVAPALSAALTDLAATGASRRILVLVSDGRLGEGEALEDVAAQVSSSGIELAVVVVGDLAQETPLRRLAAAVGGPLLRTEGVAELPRIVREALQTPRMASRREALEPLLAEPPPVLAGERRWPAVHGFSPTRARPGARVHLRAPGGAPLLVSGHAGNGRVVVMPAGLAGWARHWTGWQRFGALTAGLVQWITTPSGNPRLGLQLADGRGAFHVQVDAVSAGEEWLDASGSVRVTRESAGGGGAPLELPLVPVAPGRHVARVPAGIAEQFHLEVRVGDESLLAVHLHDGGERDARGALGDALEASRITRWSGDDLAPGVTKMSASALLAALTALLYLLMLAMPPLWRVFRVNARKS